MSAVYRFGPRSDRLQLSSVQHLLSQSGYAALILLAVVEACCIPIPSEITFGFAGVLASTGRLNFALVIVLGTLAELVGSYIAYTIGRVGGRPLVNRLGKYVLLTNRDLDRAEAWLSGRGEFAVAIGRAMPILRAFTSIVAGTAEMPAVRFGVFSFIGTLVYVTALTSIGYAVGGTWHRIANDFAIAGYVLVAVVVVLIALFVMHRLRVMRHEREAAVATPSDTSAP
jgi:membrane protein DedA with SNARE-associated domain